MENVRLLLAPAIEWKAEEIEIGREIGERLGTLNFLLQLLLNWSDLHGVDRNSGQLTSTFLATYRRKEAERPDFKSNCRRGVNKARGLRQLRRQVRLADR